MGRALLARHDVKGAREELEHATSRGYRAAAIDLANLLQDPTAGMLDPVRSVTLLETAWNQKVPIAAYELGHAYEVGLPFAKTDSEPARQADLAKAWSWYQKGADVGEPNALARFAERDARYSLAETSSTKRNSLLVRAFTRFAAAAMRADDENWPDDAWKSWRYRRATLARVLAGQGMMHQVADANRTVLAQFAPRPPTLWKQLTSALR
jgi:TPR repeat protein